MKRNLFARRRGATVIATAGLAASALAAVPASATVTDVGVNAGHNITVFHNIDFIAAFGWTEGETLTVTVERGNTVIGTSSGPAVVTPEGPGLEVNHGPEGAPVAGDCWVGHTPDIRPGDRVTVTNGTLTDQVVVDNIAFTGQPSELGNGDIVVPFVAKRANGTAIPAAFIDSGEFRAASNNQVRFEGNRVLVERQPGGAPGEYRLRYRSPFRPSRNDDNAPFNQAQLRRALLGDGHAVGFGHVAPLPLESMLHDGLGDAPGPAPGCEAAPSAQWKVTSTAPGSINLANRANGLAVRGLSFGTTSVTVALSDNDPATTGAPTATVTPTGAGLKQWTARFTQAELRGLNGRIRAVATFTVADGQFADRSTTVVKDLVAPKPPRASLRSGTYKRTKLVRLSSAPSNQVRYTLGNGKQARPTRNSGTLYKGGRIRISATQTLKMVAIDPAGNMSALAKRRYRIR